jgi:seryl-tRNA synthetase
LKNQKRIIMPEKVNVEALRGLANLAETKSEPIPMPRAADLMGRAMMQSCEEAAAQVEALGKECQQTAENVRKSADVLAKTIRDRCNTMREDIERLVIALRDTTAELNAKQETLNTISHKKIFKE